MEKVISIGKVNIKYNLFGHIAIAMLFISISPLILGIENLDSIKTAQVLEMYVAILGIILLIPIFMPEQDKNIKDLIKSKHTSILTIYIIRVVQAIMILAVFTGIFILVLKYNNCAFPAGRFYFGTMAEAIFLGGLGIIFYSVTDNIAIGYMIPMLYYMICFGGGEKYVGNFYLFSMMKGSYKEKNYLLIAGVILIIIGIVNYKRERRMFE